MRRRCQTCLFHKYPIPESKRPVRDRAIQTRVNARSYAATAANPFAIPRYLPVSLTCQ
ncbi:hypothetical protein AGR1A_Lc80210 [Agrobacterium fabacearum CFBP 5771]|nr:hypothetical protein AGR1B_Lc10844 [Agrobacterium fabacearum S56]CUX01240.1 hypothetical protein AGR1C_Lc30181 [Agrobacterium fabacearum TT111]CVI22600.1 hypothetical protein AGR1A_Lc80210 [Agrobacterium fabacearum CFBP 5771]